ncbi:MAG: glutamine synthetase type III, partial [Planctomycetota bacterium]|nr:glutamine synthetase type III [Planctomycetota bacterium]
VTILQIETNTLCTMLRTQILPAALRAQSQYADAVAATHATGATGAAAEAVLQELLDAIDQLHHALLALEAEQNREFTGPEKAMRSRQHDLIPAMEAARAAADRVESLVPADLWPLPTYAEMLLIG